MSQIRLHISQTWTRLGTEISLPQMGLKVTDPKTELAIRDPEISIDIEYPRTHIDYKRCYASMGLYEDPVELTNHLAAEAKEDVASFTAKKAYEGDMLAAVETGTSLADAVSLFTDDFKEYDVGLIPKVPPDISFDIREPQIRVVPGEVGVKLVPGTIAVNPSGGVEVYVKEKGTIKITPVTVDHDYSVLV